MGKSHAKLHAMDSVDDHTGTITDAQHGTRGIQGHPTAIPVDIGTANAIGTDTTNLSRADHVHNHPAGLGENLHHSRAHNLASATDHPDVEIVTPSDGQHLEYESATAKWKNKTPPAVPSPATTVQSETTFGLSPSVGTSTNYARADHTHGTPTAPAPAKPFMIWFSGGSAQGPNEIRYYTWGEQYAVEGYIYFRFCRDVVVKNLAVNVVTNSLSVPSYVIIRRNQVDTILAVEIPAGTTGNMAINTNSVSFSSADVLSIKVSTKNALTGESLGVNGSFEVE